jgi:sugar lactone lactonase YvrE
MKRWRIALWSTLLVCLIALAGYAVFWPCWIDPVAWTPEPDPGLVGVYAPNTALERVEPLARGASGPEDIELGPDGWLYASLRDGRIVRFDPQHSDSFQTFVDTRGYPLGLEFAADSCLVVADGERGLLEVNPEGTIRVLLDQIDGTRFRFPDDLAIAADGTIWFSDMYQTGPADLQMNAWEGVASGRLVAFQPATGIASVPLDGLRFANGVAMGPGDAYVLVTELFGARIVRLWLKGPRRGTHDVFLGALPGYPDNVTFDGADTFWIAMVSPRTRAFERWSQYPFVRAFVAKAPLFEAPHPIPSLRTHHYQAWVVGVDTTGVVRYNLQNAPGEYGALTSANAYDGQLYLGSIRMDFVGRFDLARLGTASLR